MSKHRAKFALIFVTALLTMIVGALGAASAKPAKGRHGPCEHGRHTGNPHCAATTTTSDDDDSAPGKSGDDHGKHKGRCLHGRHVGNKHCAAPEPTDAPSPDASAPADEPSPEASEPVDDGSAGSDDTSGDTDDTSSEDTPSDTGEPVDA